MIEKITNINDNIKKKDLDLILEVNRKAIEIETAAVDQNEEIIDLLTSIRDSQKIHDGKIDKIVKQSEDTNRDIFKIQVLFVTGLLSLLIQIIQMFVKK